MTRFLSIAEVVEPYARVVAVGGGAFAIRDLGVAAGTIAREEFVQWIRTHLTTYPLL